jgi:peptidyl-prolyl cis-trans isomerase A (cyclophilin A)
MALKELAPMNMSRCLVAALVLSTSLAWAQAGDAGAAASEKAPAKKAAAPAAAAASGTKWTAKVAEGKDLYATLKTSEGDVVVKLFTKDAPKTVENFVGLATGEKEWTHPATGKKSKDPLYSNLIFHRVIPNFMVQGGDPLGTGTGDPGYRFADEFAGSHKFDKVGMLAMANSGPNTNGSQFFITTAATPWLNNKHTIFGEVISGYEVVAKMGSAPRNAMDRPNKDIVLQKIEVSDKATKASKATATPTR